MVYPKENKREERKSSNEKDEQNYQLCTRCNYVSIRTHKLL